MTARLRGNKRPIIGTRANYIVTGAFTLAVIVGVFGFIFWCGQLDAVVVGGGDGSIRTVASVLVGSDVPLGIIPLGTLNHFAKDLRIPLFVDGAVAVIASGEKRYVDVGEVNGEIFINNSSIGVYPYLVLERERRRRRRRLSKWTAIVLALPLSVASCSRRAQAAANRCGLRGSCRGPVNARTYGPMVASNAAFG